MNGNAVLTRTVHVVVPAGIDDPARPSGGNVYDRRLIDALPGAGWAVRETPVAGAWPRPDAAARGGLDRALAAVPDGSAVLLDGLVACGVPEVVGPHARRLALAVLVHLPLGDEVGAGPELAARERATLAAARAVVTTGAWAARRVVAQHGVPAARVTVAVPGTDPAALAPGTDGTALTCVGALTRTKGQDVLVDALAAVAELPWRCTLVGPLDRDPAQTAAVRAAVARHGLGDRVALTGPLAGERLAAAYAATDLLVVPSRTETYGMVVAEALARGVPVLASSAGGLPDTLGHDLDGRVPGVLVPPGDVTALGAALHDWLAQPVRRDGLRRAAASRRGMLQGWEVTSRCVATVLERM